MSPVLKSAWADPWVRRPFVLALVLGFFLASSWLMIDYRGKQAWRETQQQFAREGETLDFRALLPAAIPDDQNFCAIPLLRNIAANEDDKSAVGAEGRINRAKLTRLFETSVTLKSARARPGLAKGIGEDFGKTAAAMRTEGNWPMPESSGDWARDVNVGLSHWDSGIAELAVGLDRPGAQWTPAFSAKELKRPYVLIEIPHLVVILKLQQGLSFRAAAAGVAGDLPKALQSLRISKRLALACLDEPLLINALIAQAIESLSIHAVWEICRARHGVMEDWAHLEGLNSEYGLKQLMLRTHRGELAASADTALSLREYRNGIMLQHCLPWSAPLAVIGSSASRLDRGLAKVLLVAPPGSFEGTAANFVDGSVRHFVRPLRDADWPDFINSERALRECMESGCRPWSLTNLSSGGSYLPFVNSMTHTVYTQVIMDQATVACALERIWLVRGSYPDSLEGLTLANGQPLPLDASTGQPMHYRRTEDGRYVLWANGPDGEDNNAFRGTNTSSPAQIDYLGDWVWGYQPTP